MRGLWPTSHRPVGLDGLDGRWQTVALGFLTEIGHRSGSRGTVAVYGRLIGRFLSEVDDPSLASPLDVHRFAYGAGPRGTLPSASTVAGRLAAVSGFFDFGLRMELLPRNPALGVRRPRVDPAPPRGLTVDEVERLLDAMPDTPSGRLDRAVTVTALLTGLRRAELFDLHVRQPAGQASVTYEVRTKGGTVRRRELPAPAWQAILNAYRSGGRFLPPNDAPLFAMSDTTFYAHLRRYGEAAGLGSISPHVLRHTAAKLRRRAGATIEQVSALLGHRDIAATAHYLRRLEDEQDDGWQAVAASLGLGGDDMAARVVAIATEVASEHRPRPVQEARQDDHANGRPAPWIGGVCAPLPRADATRIGTPASRRAIARARWRRVDPARPRGARATSELPALRRRAGALDGRFVLAGQQRRRRR